MRFLVNVNLVFLTYVANVGLAFLLLVLITRELGPEGRGYYALFLLAVSIAQAVLGLGMGVAAVYYLGRKAFPLPNVMSNGLAIALLSGLVCGVLALIAWPLFGDRLLDRDVPFWLFPLAVPLFVAFNFLTTVLQGSSRFQAMNSVLLVRPLVMLGVLGAGLALADLGVTAVLWFWVISFGAAVAVGLVIVGLEHIDLQQIVRPRWAALREQVTFGVQGQVGNVLQLLNYRLDSFLVLAFVNAAGVGLYAVGVAVSESVWFAANAVAIVLLPRLTESDPEEAARLTPIVCRNVLLISLVAAAALGLLSPVLIEALFGSEFSDAVPALLWLLPGTVALAGTKILASYIFSQGRPLVNSGITTATLAVTLVADLALIPPFEVAGAAAASSIAYTLSLVLSLVWYQRLSGRPLLEALVPQRGDLRLYSDALRAVFDRRLAPVEPSAGPTSLP